MKNWILPVTLGGLLAVGGLSLALSPKAPVREDAASAAVPKTAPDFAFQDVLTGKTVKLSSHAGKVRLIDFWATWCPPCRKEIPHLVELRGKYQAKGFEVIGVALDQGGVEAVKPFTLQHKMPYPSLLGDDQVASAYGGIRGIPTLFMVDRQGKIAHRYEGYTPADVLEADLKALL